MDNSSSVGSYSEHLKIKVQEKDITDKFICLVCTELPKGAIYQCKNGHFFCEECYDNPLLSICPCCRCKLPIGSNRIRNLLGEKCLDEILQVDCRFKVNGCGKRLPRNLTGTHFALCSYNLQKFGNFVNLCDKLGHRSCKYELNNGTTAMAIQHFQAEHGVRFVQQSEPCQMELVNFIKTATINQTPSPYFVTPIIAKLPAEGHGHVLLVPIINEARDFACLSIWLPDSNYDISPSTTAPPIQVEYAVKTKDNSKLVFYQGLMTIFETVKLELVPSAFKADVLTEHMHKGKDLRIVIKLLTPNKADLVNQKVTTKTDDTQGGEEGATEKAKKLVDDAEAKSKLDRETLWEFLFKLFNIMLNKPDGYGYRELAYVKKECLLLVLRNGTSAQLNFLKSKGTYLSYKLGGDANETILEYVLKKDVNKKIGLEKIKFLINAGVDFKSIDNSNRSLLHHACRYGNVQTVKYVLNELKLELDASDATGGTPWSYTEQNEDKECAQQIRQLLLEQEAELIMNGFRTY